MEVLFVVPFALFWGILQEGKLLAHIHFPDDAEPSRIRHVPRNDTWALDVERFNLLLAPKQRRGRPGEYREYRIRKEGSRVGDGRKGSGTSVEVPVSDL